MGQIPKIIGCRCLKAVYSRTGVARAGREAVTHGKERERSSSPTTSLRTNVRERLDPEEYQHAKKELKKAILEFYKFVSFFPISKLHHNLSNLLTTLFPSRFLELLNNYRVCDRPICPSDTRNTKSVLSGVEFDGVSEGLEEI